MSTARYAFSSHDSPMPDCRDLVAGPRGTLRHPDTHRKASDFTFAPLLPAWQENCKVENSFPRSAWERKLSTLPRRRRC